MTLCSIVTRYFSWKAEVDSLQTMSVYKKLAYYCSIQHAMRPGTRCSAISLSLLVANCITIVDEPVTKQKNSTRPFHCTTFPILHTTARATFPIRRTTPPHHTHLVRFVVDDEHESIDVSEHMPAINWSIEKLP